MIIDTNNKKYTEKEFKEYFEGQIKKETINKVIEIIKSWYGNQPKNRTDKSIDELIKEIEGLK